jgi:DsbC/DsbD-like thiol-disulfide interchange protein
VIHNFAAAYNIRYPMLSDRGSAVIEKFEILNPNVPKDVRFYGIPFPGQYLLAADGTVRAKLFLDDYQERPTASAVLVADLGGAAAGPSAEVGAGDVRARIALSAPSTFSGNQLAFSLDVQVAPGWHIYGEPLPQGEGLTPTAVVFDSEIVSAQNLAMPKPTPMRFAALNETYPVYEGNLHASGTIKLKQKLKPGEYKIGGVFNYQECNDSICKMPQALRFELPITIEPMVPAAPKT